jgi:hypothetical protein
MDLEQLVLYVLKEGHCDVLLVVVVGVLLYLHKQNRERIAALLEEIRRHGWPNG